MVIVLMGVSGSGKTAVGERLAAALGGTFAEGDAYHPPANVEKMKSGHPLDDADRQPWLETLAREIGRWLDAGQIVVLACSALKQRYRDILKGGRPGVRFVYLHGSEALIQARLAGRRGHFMPAKLLASQFAALEEPGDAITVEIDQLPDKIVDKILTALAQSPSGRPRSPGAPESGSSSA
jgi:gluconokinase